MAAALDLCGDGGSARCGNGRAHRRPSGAPRSAMAHHRGAARSRGGADGERDDACPGRLPDLVALEPDAGGRRYRPGNGPAGRCFGGGKDADRADRERGGFRDRAGSSAGPKIPGFAGRAQSAHGCARRSRGSGRCRTAARPEGLVEGSAMSETKAEAERHRVKMAKRKAVHDVLVAGTTTEKGLLIVHTGTGKGKSTA